MYEVVSGILLMIEIIVFFFFVAMDIHSNWFSYDILDQVLKELYISIDYCGLQMLRLALVNAR
jgi:hypothetical protein